MRRFRPTLIALSLLGLLCGTASAEIRDNGRLFSAEAITKAKATITEIEKRYKRRVVVETFAEIPSDRLAAYDMAGKDKAAQAKFFRDWLRDQAKADGATGVFILICKKPGHVEVQSGTETRKKDFTLEDDRELRSHFVDAFREKQFDEGLTSGLDFIENTMKAHQGIKTQPEVAKPSATPQVKTNQGGGGGGMTLMGMVCVIGGIVLAFWVISSLIRALTGMGRGMVGGQPGYMGGPGYVGGGGGFMSTFMSSMFGSMAGNWMYNSFFGGGHSGGWNNPSYGGDGGMIGGGGGAMDDRFDNNSAGGDFNDDAGSSGGFFGGNDDAGGGGGFFGGGDGGGFFGGDGGGDFGGGGDGGGDF